MRKIATFKIFESSNELKDKLMGDILHLYSSIPVPKEKSSSVIKRIILNSDKKLYKLDQDIDLQYRSIHDRVRFSDYFDSLLNNKDIRGHNFEGFLCGVYGGVLNTRGGKYDITVGNKNLSVKFYDSEDERIVLGSYKSILQDYKEQIDEYGGVGKIFQSDDELLKEEIWEIISEDVDGWLIAYPKGNEIFIHHFTTDQMAKFVLSGNTVAPKGGWEGKYSLAISSTYTEVDYQTISKIRLPSVTIDDLVKLAKNSDEIEFSQHVFGDMGKKIRPDVIRYIMNNKKTIIKRLSEK